MPHSIAPLAASDLSRVFNGDAPLTLNLDPTLTLLLTFPGFSMAMRPSSSMQGVRTSLVTMCTWRRLRPK